LSELYQFQLLEKLIHFVKDHEYEGSFILKIKNNNQLLIIQIDITPIDRSFFLILRSLFRNLAIRNKKSAPIEISVPSLYNLDINTLVFCPI